MSLQQFVSGSNWSPWLVHPILQHMPLATWLARLVVVLMWDVCEHWRSQWHVHVTDVLLRIFATSVPSGMTNFRPHLCSASPASAYSDNAAWVAWWLRRLHRLHWPANNGSQRQFAVRANQSDQQSYRTGCVWQLLWLSGHDWRWLGWRG